MGYLKIGLLAAGLFGLTTYVSYKYTIIKQFEQDFYKAKNKRSMLLKVHQGLAMQFDSIMDNYERFTKIPQYRKILCSYANGLVLETGVGTSRNLKYYPPTCKVLGVDWSSNILEVALQKSVHNVDHEYKLEDVEHLSFKENTFDCILDTFGLEYYVNPDQALQEMKRVCKKDGYILILTSGYSHYDLLNLYLEYKTPYTVCNQGYFPNRKWNEIITEKDFQIVKSERKMNGTVYLFVLKNLKEK